MLSRPALSSTIVHGLPGNNPFTCSAKRYFQEDLVVNRWDPAKNTCTMQLLTGGGYTTVTASSTQTVTDDNTLPGWKRIRATFDVGATVNSYFVKTILTRTSDGFPARRVELSTLPTG